MNIDEVLFFEVFLSVESLFQLKNFCMNAKSFGLMTAVLKNIISEFMFCSSKSVVCLDSSISTKKIYILIKSTATVLK